MNDCAKKKSTQELLKILEKSTDAKQFVEEYKNDFADITLSEYINDIIEKKHLTKSDVVRFSNLSQVYVYKIFSGERAPHRDKLLCLAFGLQLDTDETQRMLKIADAGALYPRVRRDSIIMFAIKEHTDIITCNEMLYELGEKILE
jgi:transcriptional regulator with XRE-family HTH domain